MEANKNLKVKSGKKSIADITLEDMKLLPKADLHRHLDGSVRPQTIVELAAEQGVEIPSMDAEELSRHICVDKKECNSLVDYLEGFDITLKVMQKAYAITRIMYEVCEDAHFDGLTYIEVRFSPILHTREGLALSEVMEAVCEGQFMAMGNLPITVGIIVSGMRQLPPTVTETLAEITWRYRRKGVIGFDLAGPEDGFSSYYHRKAFRVVRNRSINTTLHSGEAAGAVYVKDALMYCGAHRLGHGVRVTEDEELTKFVIDRRIPLEMCVTSNEQTKAVDKKENHPIKLLNDRGAIIIPCTDNTTVSNVTLSEEYLRIIGLFDFSMYDIVRFLDNGFRAAFMDNTMKLRMRADCLKKVWEILVSKNYDVSGVEKYASDHLFELGVDFKDIAPPYWKGWSNPEITEETIRMIPKTDLHCRICGSVSLPQVWKELNMAGIDIKKYIGHEVKTLEELRPLIQRPTHNDESIQIAKRLFYSVLQNKDQLSRAVDNILVNAAADGVMYIDMMIRPVAHMKKGLSADDVLDAVLAQVKKTCERLGNIRAGIVIYGSPSRDDPLVFRDQAELAVRRRPDGVVGFGVYGEEDMPSLAYPYFASTFEYLKANNMNVGMGAGRSDVGTIIEAIHTGGAFRLSGAFQVHRFPRLMTYLANHRLPVEMRMSDKFDAASSDVQSYLGDSPIRLYLDNGLLVTPCSFALSLYPTTRSQFIFSIVKECHLNIAETLKLLSHGFQSNFLSYGDRQRMHGDFWITASNSLTPMGFRHFYKMPYFAPSIPPVMTSPVMRNRLNASPMRE